MANAEIPSDVLDLFQGTALAHLSVVTASGRPSVTPVWIAVEGDLVLVNSAKGRMKNRLMDVGTHVALSIVDPENPYRFVTLQGTVVERSDRGADEQLERLSERYLGKAYPWRQPGEQRELFFIQPTRVRMSLARHFPGTGKSAAR